MGKTAEQLDAELVAATEADDSKRASEILKQIEDLPADAPVVSAEAIGLESTVAKEATTTMEASESIVITKASLGAGGFTPVLAGLSSDEINLLMVEVSDAEDLMALIIPGTSVLDADHRIHLAERGDVKRAARGLALAAAGGVDMDSQVILSNSGRAYTIEEGICYELKRVEQPDFQGNVAILEQKVPCKGHLEYKKTESGFELTGRQHLRCLHQWALMFQLGFFVTASIKVYAEIVRTEVGSRVGDDAARKQAQAQVDVWVQNSDTRREVRTGFAQAITAQKNELGLSDNAYLPAKTEIGGYALPDGLTISQAVTNLRGRQFALKVELPMNGKTVEIVTRTVKNLTELASVVAPHFAVARQNSGELVAVELIAR